MVYFVTDADAFIDEDGDGRKCVYFMYIDVQTGPSERESLSLDDVFAEAADEFLKKAIPDAFDRLQADQTLHLVGVTTTIEPPDKENWAEISRGTVWAEEWELPNTKSVFICNDAVRLLDLDQVTSFWVRFYLVSEEQAKNWYPGGDTHGKIG